MCTTIEAEFILALLLESQDKITGKMLRRFRAEIYRRLSGENVYCDIAGDSICAAVENNPTFFSWQEEDIVRSANWSQDINKDYIEKNLGRYLSPGIRQGAWDVSKVG